MALNKAIIDVAGADTVLALEPDWQALDPTVKTRHIEIASTHIQINWSCVDVDWDIAETIPTEIQEACAYYAFANSKGNLYASAASQVKGQIAEETGGLGPMKETIKYFEDGNAPDPLQYPDSLMGFYCERAGSSGAVKAVRT